jgi:hypothetical protein
MILYAYYTSQGRYVQTGTSVAQVLESDIPAGCSVYYGAVDIFAQYHDVATNTPASKGTAPSDGHKFDYATKAWVPDTDYLNSRARHDRGQLLQSSDWTQIPNSPLTITQQTAWATYRQALRDIPQQTGYPVNITWPIAPA